MKDTLSNRTMFVSFLFSFLLLMSYQSSDILNAQSGNINGIYSEVTLSEGQLHLHNKLTKRVDGTFRFYLPLSHALSNIKMSNEQGEEIKYNHSESNNIIIIEAVTDAETQNIIVDYDVDLRKLKPSISYQQDKNQLFILSETPIFPINHKKSTPDNITYSVKASDATGNYSYSKQSTKCNAFFPLPIIYGNFKIVESDGVKVHIPDDVRINKDVLDYTIACIVNSCNYYTKIYGENEFADDINLFFLNRRGGYALEDGIILSQEYISSTTVKHEELAELISHEIAHLWWGRGVKPKSTSISEGLAELSSDLYLIENEQWDSKNIYANKNNTILLSNIKPENIERLSNANYKTFAYSKLPIILHEAELQIGRENLKKALSNFYLAEKNSSELAGFEEMINYFPTNYQLKLRKEIDGTLDNWPDYYIKSVSGNTVVFKGNNIYFPEIVPVQLITDKNEIINDTLHFNVAATEITRQYQHDIVKIIIDNDFAINQSELLNDVWRKNSNSILDNKWQQEYPAQHRTFFNSLLNYLFTETSVKIDNIVDKDSRSALSATKENLMKRNLYNAYFEINESNNHFKIMVTLNTSRGFENGFIEGQFYEKNNIINLKSIIRIKIHQLY